MLNLYPHQQQALEATADKNRVAYYHDMGLGKTFTGSEKMIELGAKINLVICQKSKIDDWLEHFKKHYEKMWVLNLTNVPQFNIFVDDWICSKYKDTAPQCVAVINYELAFRRPELLKLHDFTLMLDESSLIQNENAKRSKFILKLDAANVILLSGTPTGGKYELLWSQLHLLGWNISKNLYWRQFVDTEIIDNEGFPIKVVRGYKNVERLKSKMRKYGCHFLKTEDVLDLPEQVDQIIKVNATKEYRIFRKDSIVAIKQHVELKTNDIGDKAYYDGAIQLVGDSTLTKMLYERQLCGQYNADKLAAFEDLAAGTDDRLIVFYNFNSELEELKGICNALQRPYSVVNGRCKDLTAYDNKSDSITLIQYQAGAMGLNLQKSNKIIYYTPPLSSELFEQSKKRTHRIGQKKTCFYYYLTCKNSIEEKIYKTLAMRKDYTEALFESEE